jgi:hypothetical protein
VEDAVAEGVFGVGGGDRFGDEGAFDHLDLAVRDRVAPAVADGGALAAGGPAAAGGAAAPCAAARPVAALEIAAPGVREAKIGRASCRERVS